MRRVRRTDNLANFICRLSRNLGSSTSWNLVQACTGSVFTFEQKCVPISPLSHSFYMTRTSHPPELYGSNIFAVGYKVQGTKYKAPNYAIFLASRFYLALQPCILLKHLS